jgi:ArsR family transcriptional regulator
MAQVRNKYCTSRANRQSIDVIRLASCARIAPSAPPGSNRRRHGKDYAIAHPPVLFLCPCGSGRAAAGLAADSTGFAGPDEDAEELALHLRRQRICQCIYNKSVNPAPKNSGLPLLFAALADRTRLRLLNLMDGKEVCVCYFVEVLGQSQPKISRHLAYLRRAGVVVARREGKWMHYKIAAPKHAGAARILSETLSVLRGDKLMQADIARLAKACCAPQLYPLEGAPLPTPAEPCAC